MMLFFGLYFSLKGGEKGAYTRAYEVTLIAAGAVGSVVMWATGLGKPTPGGAGGGRCSECGERMPLVRRPANRRQLLWGGWTCAGCGAELDRRGRKIDPTAG